MLNQPGFSCSTGCFSCPGFHLHLGASDCSPGLAFCFMGLWTFATTRAKTGRTAHVFIAQGGTHRIKGPDSGQHPEKTGKGSQGIRPQEDKIALTTCLEKLNVSGAFLKKGSSIVIPADVLKGPNLPKSFGCLPPTPDPGTSAKVS